MCLPGGMSSMCAGVARVTRAMKDAVAQFYVGHPGIEVLVAFGGAPRRLAPDRFCFRPDGSSRRPSKERS